MSPRRGKSYRDSRRVKIAEIARDRNEIAVIGKTKPTTEDTEGRRKLPEISKIAKESKLKSNTETASRCTKKDFHKMSLHRGEATQVNGSVRRIAVIAEIAT